jgi:hypothetical protein
VLLAADADGGLRVSVRVSRAGHDVAAGAALAEAAVPAPGPDPAPAVGGPPPGADLRCEDLKGADLNGADLNGADPNLGPRARRCRVEYAYAVLPDLGRRWAVRVWVDAAPVLTAPIDLARAVGGALDGRAWVGFSSCSRPDASSARGAEDALRLLSWRYRAAPRAGMATTKRAVGTSGAASGPAPDGRAAGRLPGDLWQDLSLELDVRPPLQLVVTQRALERYNALFQFLLTTKRVSAELQRAWVGLNATRFRLSRGAQRRRMQRLWLLRSRMSFFVENLLFYLQEDVVDAQFSRLMRTVEGGASKRSVGARSENARNARSENARERGVSRPPPPAEVDFDSVVRAHSRFLEELTRQSFLDVKVVRTGVRDVLEACLALCALAERFAADPGRDAASAAAATADAELDTIERTFRSTTSFLIVMLKKTRRHAALVTRLDYNGFFGRGGAA